MKLKRAQSGLAMVEAAIILPVFLLVMFAIMEFGIILYDKAVLTNASREAARSGIALKDPKLTTAQIQAIATSYCRDNLANFRAANLAPPTVTPSPTPTTFGTPLKVIVTYDYPYILGNFFGLGLTLRLGAETTMKNE